MVIKFVDTDSIADAEIKQTILNRISIYGASVISAGDYIVVTKQEDQIRIVKQTDYQNNADFKRKVVEEVAIQLLEDMIQALQDLSVTDAVKLDLLKTVDVVLIMVVGNKIQAGRVICNAIATTANFTNGRKNTLLAMMDAAIALL